MSSDDIVPFDCPRGLFGGHLFDDMFRGFYEMRRMMEVEFQDMEREFENIEKWTSEDFVREYNIPRRRKVRKVKSIVYRYSMSIGPDRKPKVRESENVKPSRKFGRFMRPDISRETGIEPLVDITMTDKEVKATVQMPIVSKDKIKINIYDNTVEVKSKGPQRRYHQTFEIPHEAIIETAKSFYNNGILEITFKKKDQTKRKGMTIKVE